MTSHRISDAHLSLQASLCRKMQARETGLVSALTSATLGLKPLLPVCFFPALHQISHQSPYFPCALAEFPGGSAPGTEVR